MSRFARVPIDARLYHPQCKNTRFSKPKYTLKETPTFLVSVQARSSSLSTGIPLERASPRAHNYTCISTSSYASTLSPRRNTELPRIDRTKPAASIDTLVNGSSGFCIVETCPVKNTANGNYTLIVIDGIGDTSSCLLVSLCKLRRTPPESLAEDLRRSSSDSP